MIGQLNKYQKEAAEHLNGPCLVTSCPGSGKTFTLVERIVCLLKRGVKQRNILCLTFTNKAAKEMKERVCKRLNIKKPSFFIGTFHSLCSLFIRKLGSGRGYSPHFTIVNDKEQLDLMLQISRKHGVDINYGDAKKIVNRVNYYRDQMEDFSWVENALHNDVFVEIARKYLSYCKKNNLLDFSALIYEAIQIIDNDKEIKKKIQNTFKYILVDETQDTNISQFYLVNLLGGKWKNIMLIGDVDQSIYGWRGARYENIREFMRMYNDCKIISLSKNYRSTPQIIQASSKLIKRNTSHMETKFETDNSDGEPVRTYGFRDQLSEAQWVGNMAKKLIDEGGWDPGDIAVLYRVNKMSEPVEQSMVTNTIPYEVVGSWNFYDRKEVKDCLAMIRFLVNRRDSIAFHRICVLIKGMGNVTIGKIDNLAEEKDISLLRSCQEIGNATNSKNTRAACKKICDIYKNDWDFSNPAKSVHQLIDRFNYREYIDSKFDGDANERKDNIDQIIDASGEFNGMENGLFNYLQQISLITSVDSKNDKNKVSLMSLHSSKGLEFPIVFMIGVEDGILPHQQAIADDPFNGLEEERRLCYVGMTRAKKMLYMTWCKSRKRFGQYGNKSFRHTKPSNFLIESGLRDG